MKKRWVTYQHRSSLFEMKQYLTTPLFQFSKIGLVVSVQRRIIEPPSLSARHCPQLPAGKSHCICECQEACEGYEMLTSVIENRTVEAFRRWSGLPTVRPPLAVQLEH